MAQTINLEKGRGHQKRDNCQGNPQGNLSGPPSRMPCISAAMQLWGTNSRKKHYYVKYLQYD